MAENGVNKGRRRFLVGATAVVGAVGAVGVAIPFLGSWQPSAKARAAGAPVEVDVSKLEPGQQMTVEWRGKPVWVARRDDAVIERLKEIDSSQLRDPDSGAPQQPDYVDPVLRSIKPEFMVLIGICTHLGCVPSYRPEPGAADLGGDWPGGYFCPCHGSRFDLAGRVFTGVPAPLNLLVPPYRYDTDTTIVIGEDQEAS
ncbi:ubiquinol-cytochrome c reductase iron-sulfur subunit [Halomonas sp. PR-M31]|uniref:ubiquinol-cytochrome c reductase iron-sulfur subunit n=1 Tax=Halomonas sp. PR-M31 TaxID=1471202 RepID=UPI0006511E17|nr:ubiquinol-cytochrome c reductase iron-sulfur subunit [Halomonas sp. PR-M31]